MGVTLTIRYNLDDIFKEFKMDKSLQPVGDILVFQMKDKFFLGGGCEESPSQGIFSNHRRRIRNISICSNDLV